MDVREIIARALIDADPTMSGYHQSHIDIKGRTAGVILAALKEAGYVVTELEPARERVWVQNLCGFIDGTFTPLDDKWQEIWKQRVRALAAAQEQGE